MESHNDTKLFDTTKRLEKRLKEREHEYLTYEQFHILVGTFNVNNRQAPLNILLEEWLYRQNINENTDRTVVPDIIAVGFQEIDTSSGAYIYDDKKKEDEWERIVRKTIKHCYKTHDDSQKFQLLNRVRLMGILLFVYVRAVHMSKCTLTARSTVPTGFMGIAGNKGGVGISFRFYETAICFVNCHFASGDGQTQRRNDDYQTVESRMLFTSGIVSTSKDDVWYTSSLTTTNLNVPTFSGQPKCMKINDHDLVFWFGDMNYRISHANEYVRRAIVDDSSSRLLQEKDQLRCEMKFNRVFKNYSEASFDFLPTYKFDINSDNYDTSEKFRTPSWTDRILYHTKRTTVKHRTDKEIDLIRPLYYLSANSIKFSDHRPVSALYLVAIKYACNEKALIRIREELIRQIDREENDAIPTVEVRPRPIAIVFDNVRYLDKCVYTFSIKNIGECMCVCSIYSPSAYQHQQQSKRKNSFEDPFFDSLLLKPNPPYVLDIGEEQTIEICFQMKGRYSWLFGKELHEILIFHIENGADTFITVDITLDMGPFGLAFHQYPPTLYDSARKQFVYSKNSDMPTEGFIEMKGDPPALFISLIDCLKDRNDIDLLTIFNSEVQDSIDLIPIRNQIYENNYNFENFSSLQVFMILLHLLQSLPEPLVTRDIQDLIFLNGNSRSYILPSGISIQSHIPGSNIYQPPRDMSKAIGVIIEKLQPKERNLFFRLLLLLQKIWPTPQQIGKLDNDTRTALNLCIDVLALSILHEYADQNQRHAFLIACLNEEKKKTK